MEKPQFNATRIDRLPYNTGKVVIGSCYERKCQYPDPIEYYKREDKWPKRIIGVLLVVAVLYLLQSCSLRKDSHEEEFKLQACAITGCYPKE